MRVVDSRLEERNKAVALVNDKLSEAVHYIIVKLGFVEMSLKLFNINNALIKYDSSPVASIIYDSHRRGFKLVINAFRFNELSIEERAFVLLHEIMHYVLKHVSLYHKYVTNGVYSSKLFKIAADISVNDILIETYNRSDIQLPRFELWHPYLGIKMCGTQCHDKSIKEIMALLRVCDAADISEEYTDTNDDSCDRAETQAKDIMENKDGGIEDSTAIEKQEAQTIAGDIEKMRVAANHEAIVKQITGQSKLRTVPNSLDTYTWNRIPRSRKCLDPTVYGVMPDYKRDYGNKPVVAIAIDFSSSVTQRQMAMFVALSQAMPKTIWDIRTFKFTTKCEELIDAINVYTLRYGGGTSFDSIAQKILDSYVKYPDAVVVITDGDAPITNQNVTPEEFKKRWVWVLDDTGPTYNTIINKYGPAMYGKKVKMSEVAKKL